jgi:intracellular sulfur oxidation DsrE/DsrF family protein
MRALVRLLPLLAMLFVQPALADTPHRVALQITDNDADKMNAVLNVAANVAKYYSDKGEEIEIQVVAFNAGLHMLRDDTSPVKPRIASFAKSMPNVSFKACQNTIDGMTKREGKPIPIVGEAERVPSGAVTLIELSEKGWTILRP